MSTPYGVPPAVMSLSVVNTPDESKDAIVVLPYLNTSLPPDSWIVKFVVATEPAEPVVFWFNVGNVQLVNVPEEGVPRAGVTSVGLVAKTKAPEPVSPVTAAAKLAEDGVAKNVATPEPNPEMPVATGKPVQFVNVPESGVPSVGVVIVGLANVGEIKCVFCWAKFVPSLHTVIVLPAGMATPVPAAVVLPITVEL
jgi:hypothetical protein